MLSVKQGGIKYHFGGLCYDLTWDWTPVSLTIGEYSTHLANDPVDTVCKLFVFWGYLFEGLMVY